MDFHHSVDMNGDISLVNKLKNISVSYRTFESYHMARVDSCVKRSICMDGGTVCNIVLSTMDTGISLGRGLAFSGSHSSGLEH